MLRSRLYIGMLPVVGLLILVCLYQIYQFNILGNRLDSLQNNHFSAISRYERLSLATSQIERAILLKQEKEADLAASIYARSEPSLTAWLSERDEPSEALTEDDTLWLLARNLRTLARAVFSEKSPFPKLEMLGPLVERIQASTRGMISVHNGAIANANTTFRDSSRNQYYIVVSAILASILLMGFVAFTLSQRILAPIDALTASASSLANEGNWDTDFQPSSKDEISKLEVAYLEMAKRIRTYKKQTSRQMMRTRRRMEECFNNLPHPVLFLNAKRQIAYKNPAAAALISIPDWANTLFPALMPRIETVFGTGEEVLTTDFDESVSILTDGEIVYYLPIFVRIDNEDIDDIECGVVLQDVTQLRLSDELKSDLVATVSHEIKTPVTSATMALHLVLDKSLGSLNEDQESMINIAHSDLKRLLRLLDHFLEIARLEGRTSSLERSPTDTNTLVSQVIDGFAMSAQSKEIALVSEVVNGLPAIEIDFKAMEVALSNYVSNAIKYSPPGSRVKVYARQNADRIRLGVIDEGPGISKDDTEKVFNKFYRSSNGKQRDGVGLGLSIVRDVAIAHGGRAGCESNETRGSNFYIEIPVAK